MDAPRLPSVVAGRSALPAFLALEAWARTRTAEAEAGAAAHLAASEEEAVRIRAAGEQALEQAVLDAEHEALREVETRQRDKVSEARQAVELWIQTAEVASERTVAAALALLTGDARTAHGEIRRGGITDGAGGDGASADGAGAAARGG